METCALLDRHLAEQNLKPSHVADAYALSEQLRRQAGVGDNENSGRARTMQREATVALHGLFDFSGGARGVQHLAPGQEGWRSHGSQIEGNMRMIDDDAGGFLRPEEVLSATVVEGQIWTPEVESRRKKLLKKLRQVAELEEKNKKEPGLVLNADQEAKILSGPALRTELETLPKKPEGYVEPVEAFPDLGGTEGGGRTSGGQPKQSKQPKSKEHGKGRGGGGGGKGGKERGRKAPPPESAAAWGSGAPCATGMVSEMAMRQSHVKGGNSKGYLKDNPGHKPQMRRYT